MHSNYRILGYASLGILFATHLSAQVPTITRGRFAVPVRDIPGAVDVPTCALSEEPLPDGSRFFPDQKLVHARNLTRGTNVRALGEAAITIPIGDGADALGAATAGTAFVDGHVPVPGRQEQVTLCKVDEDGRVITGPDGKPVNGVTVTRNTDALLRFRLITNFSVEPNVEDAVVSERNARTVVGQESGLVNLQLSRYLYGWQLTDFSFLVRASAGAGVHQLTDPGGEEPNYHTLFYGGAQFNFQVPIEALAVNGAPSSLLLAVEPFARSLPENLRPAFEGESVLYGTIFRGMVLVGDRVGIGVTYRNTAPAVPEAARISIDLVYLR